MVKNSRKEIEVFRKKAIQRLEWCSKLILAPEAANDLLFLPKNGTQTSAHKSK